MSNLKVDLITKDELIEDMEINGQTVYGSYPLRDVYTLSEVCEDSYEGIIFVRNRYCLDFQIDHGCEQVASLWELLDSDYVEEIIKYYKLTEEDVKKAKKVRLEYMKNELLSKEEHTNTKEDFLNFEGCPTSISVDRSGKKIVVK